MKSLLWIPVAIICTGLLLVAATAGASEGLKRKFTKREDLEGDEKDECEGDCGGCGCDECVSRDSEKIIQDEKSHEDRVI